MQFASIRHTLPSLAPVTVWMAWGMGQCKIWFAKDSELDDCILKHIEGWLLCILGETKDVFQPAWAYITIFCLSWPWTFSSVACYDICLTPFSNPFTSYLVMKGGERERQRQERERESALWPSKKKWLVLLSKAGGYSRLKKHFFPPKVVTLSCT